MVDGTVKHWNDVEGWGVLVSPEVPGEVSAHFSRIAHGDKTGYRTLYAGDRVRFEVEHYPPGQDGFFWRAKRVLRMPAEIETEFSHLSDVEIKDRIRAIDQGADAGGTVDLASRERLQRELIDRLRPQSERTVDWE